MLLYMRAINYKSDYDFIPKLKDRNGKEVRFPDCDWEAVLWVSNKANNYKVSRKGEQYTNCFVEENGDVHFVVNGHHLGIGVLKWDLHVALPNEIYPDGLQHLCWPESLDIELVAGAGDCPTTAELEAMLPYIKGEPFTYDDFTPEQIAELQKPATDAAASVSELETNIQETEALRKDAEQTRISNENSRTSAENDRVRDENIRKANETSRQSDETSRQSNETARVEAETARAEEFAAWQGEIDSKADRSELSNVFAEEPLTPENFPDISTYNREELKKDLFIDMWDSAWGKYGKYDPDNAPDAEHPYMGNEIWMTYEEAMDVLAVSVLYTSDAANLYAHKYPKVRTLIPTRLYGVESLSYMFAYCDSLVAIRLISGYGEIVRPSSVKGLFYYCANLRTVSGIINLTDTKDADSFVSGCPKLEILFLSNIKIDIDLSPCPLLQFASMQYMIDNAANTAAITVTVHPDVYAKLSDETNAEWHALLAQAAEKNIIFATL